MTKEVIEKYIQFAIDNGFLNGKTEGFSIYGGNDFTISFSKKGYLDMFYELKSFHFTELITSKEFIEAVARGLNPTYELDSPGFYSEMLGITHKQADAIRENSVDGVSLEEFILELIK